MASAAKEKSKYYDLIQMMVGCLIMFGIGKIPPVEPITQYGMQVLGVFVGMIYLWISVGVLWPSILGIAAMMLLGHAKPASIIQAAFGSDTVWFVIFIGIFIVPLNQEHVTEFIAKFFLTRKITKGHPWIFLFFFIFATFVVAMVTNAVPSILLMWAILYSILDALEIKPGNKFGGFMVFSVVFGAALGTAAFPFKGAVLTILNAYTAASEIAVDKVSYWFVAVLVGLVMMVSFVLFGKFVLHLDASKLSEVDANQYFIDRGFDKMSTRQKALLAMLGVNTLLLLWPSVMPKAWVITGLVSRLSSWGSTALVMVVMMVVQVEGKPLMNFKQSAAKLEWSTVFLVASALYVAGQLSAEDTGIVPYIANVFGSLISGGSEMLIVMFFLVVGLIVTNFANNAAMGAMLMPLVYAITSTGGYHGVAVAACLAMILFEAYLTPSASVHASLLHGNREWISLKEIYVYGSVTCIYALVVIALIGRPLAVLFLG